MAEWLSGCSDFASRVAHPLKVNKEVMKGKPATQHFVPVGAEIWLATPSHPANIIETWGGPFTFTEDGLNFKYHSSGILLRKAITLQHH